MSGMISFDENVAHVDGGAIWAMDPTGIDIRGAAFYSNKAAFGGGAVSLTSTEWVLGEFQDCQFDGNSASHGGALHLNAADGEMFVRSSSFHHNVAGER